MRVGVRTAACLRSLCIVWALLSSSAVDAGDTHIDFHIPRQNADAALNLFAQQADMQLLFRYDVASRFFANRVSGRYTVEDALALLLEDTGLQAVFSKQGSVTIQIDDRFQGDAVSKRTGFWSKLGTFLLSVVAAIQSAPAQEPGAASAPLEEVIVTAQKRAESIQSVPITMDAFTGEYLQDLQVNQADDIVKLAPNLTFNYSNEANTSISIRGIGTDNFHGNVNRAVGIYYDEVYAATPYSGTLGVFDLERVEVLRGPQNTLFGRNTTGGAVQYISRKPVPGESAGGYGRLTYGRFDQLDLEGAISIPLGADAAARIAVQSVNRDGPFTNLAPGREGEELGQIERHSVRAQLAWEPGAYTSILFSFQAGFNRSDTRGSKAQGARDPDDPTQFCPSLSSSEDFETPNSCVALTGFNPSTPEWSTLYNVSSARADIDVTGGAVSIDHEFTWATLTSVTSFYRTEVQLADDIAGISTLQFVPHQDSEFENFSQELRLRSADDRSLRWIAGAYYFHEDLLQGTLVRRDANGAQAPGGEVTAFNILDQKDEDLSVYGQIEADLSEKLTLTAGLRYTNNRKSADSQFGVAVTPTATIPADTFISRDLVLQLTEGAPFACPPPPAPCRVPLLQPEQEIEELGAKLGFDYRFTDNLMGYASYARGFKSGGFDTRALAAFAGTAGRAVDPETLDAFELGFKSDLFDDTLRFNAAAFYYEWKDQQTFATIDGIPSFLNIPGSELLGFETTLRWVPRHDWSFQAGVGLLETEVTDSGGLDGVDEGHELKNSPAVSLNGQISKDLIVADNLLNVQLGMRYVSEQLNSLEFENDFLTTRSSQFYLDVRASYRFGVDGQYRLSVFGENLTSEKHCLEKDLQDSPVVIAPGAVTSVVACSPNIGRPVYGVTALVNF